MALKLISRPPLPQEAEARAMARQKTDIYLAALNRACEQRLTMPAASVAPRSALSC